LYENAVTLLQNKNNLIPLQQIDSLRIAAVSFGDTNITAFQRALADYAFVDFYNIGKYPKKEFKDSLLKDSGNL
jgi:beta-N-acetylhexosaminidase